MAKRWIHKGLGVIVEGVLFKFAEYIYDKFVTLIQGTWKEVKGYMKEYVGNYQSLSDTIYTLINMVKQDIRKCDFCSNKCACKKNSKGKWYSPGCA